MTSPHAFGLETASPLQRAICRVADGIHLGELAHEKTVVDALGEEVIADLATHPEGERPREICLLSAIRSAKSLWAGVNVFHNARTCDLSGIRADAGEHPRSFVMSISKANGQVIMEHVNGTLMRIPWMRRLVVGEPKADHVTIRHPSGGLIRIELVAGKRAGGSLTSYWCAGAVFDEAPRMVGGSEGVINYDDSRKAVYERMLPRAQIASIGSPWAPFGPIHELERKHWRKPGGPIVIRAPGWAMNPVFWTPERCERLKREEPDVWITDCAAEFASPEESLFGQAEVDACTRQLPMVRPRVMGAQYRAAMDPATRSNSWTLVIATRDGNQLIIAKAQQWTGTKLEPLNPAVVLAEIAEVCREYGVTYVLTDQYHADSLASIARGLGLSIQQVQLNSKDRIQRNLNLKTRLGNRTVELPPDPVFRADLMRVQRVPTANGGVEIRLPHTSDGRHCDYAPSTMLALNEWLADIAPPEKTPEEIELERMEAAAKRRFLASQPGRKRKYVSQSR